jgi:hypothetical protein
MLGNRTGWIIAGLILVAECAGIVYALSLDAVTPPTALATSASLAPIVLPPEPAAMIPQPGSANATALYRSAIADYLARADEIEAMIRDSNRAGLTKLPAMDKIMAAATASGDTLFADHVEEIIVYGEPNTLQAISRLGYAAFRIGALQGRRPVDRPRAMEYFRAAFVLGKRLAHEKLTWREYDAGVGLMSEAGAAMLVDLNKLPDRAADAAALQAFLDAQKAQYKENLRIFEALYSNSETTIATHAGDVFAFASDSKETMWRVEAILKLGRLRYNVGTPPVPGNQRHANRLLRRLKDAEDPIIRQAAEVASGLSVEQFRTLR